GRAPRECRRAPWAARARVRGSRPAPARRTTCAKCTTREPCARGTPRLSRGAPNVGVWGPFRGRLRNPEERHGLARGASERCGFGGHFGAACAIPRSATAWPAALPSVGGLGAISGPLAQSRGAPRLGRGASERWGFGG